MSDGFESEDNTVPDSIDDTENEDTENEDSEAAEPEAFYGPVPRRPFASQAVTSLYDRGVRAGIVTANGRSVLIRMPTAVATARGVRLLNERSRRLEAVVVDQGRQLRAVAAAERRQGLFTLGSVGLQQVRDTTSAVARAFPVPGTTAAMAAIDYTMSTAQTAIAVAAIPPVRRNWALATMPFVVGMATTVAQEYLRTPPGGGVGFGPVAGKRGWPLGLTLALPAVAGIVAGVVLFPRRRERRVRF